MDKPVVTFAYKGKLPSHQAERAVDTFNDNGYISKASCHQKEASMKDYRRFHFYEIPGKKITMAESK